MSELRESCTMSIERDMIEQPNVSKIIKGSKTKQDSITNGMQTITTGITNSFTESICVAKNNMIKTSQKENNQKNQLDKSNQIVRESEQCCSISYKNPNTISCSSSNNNNNKNNEFQIEMSSYQSEKSSKQCEYNLELKAKWVFTRLVEMNIINYTHPEVENILNLNEYLQSMKKEDILQHFIDTNLKSDYQDKTLIIEMNQINRSRQGQIDIVKNKKYLEQVQQNLGDDKVSEMENSESEVQDIKYHKSIISPTIIAANEINILRYKQNNRLSRNYYQKVYGKVQNRSYLLSEEDGGVTCSICCLSYLPEYFYILLSCNHLFCKGCITQYLENCINTSKVLKIRCPDVNCNLEFTDQILVKVLDVKMYEKYQKFKQLKIINSDPTLKWCNRQGCTLYCKINPNNQKIKCQCGHEMCFSCGNNWHEGKTCEDQIQEEFQGAISKYVISFCPTCKSKVQKASGCNRILCPICSKYFCWICRSPNISYAHFSHLNVLGCPGKQFSKSNPEENPKYSKLLLFIPRLIIFFIILTFFIAILPFCLVGFALITPNYLYWNTDELEYNPNKTKHSFKKAFAISTLLLLVGIVLFPICLLPGSCIVSHRIIKNRL